MISEAYGGEAEKKLRVSVWHKWLKVSSYFEIANEENAYHFLPSQGYCSL
jgi:hypothetical protein